MTNQIYIVTPIFNDWESFALLVKNIGMVDFTQNGYTINIVAINDCSTQVAEVPPTNIPISILNLKMNVGHQRAIAIGLQFIYNEVQEYEHIVVMDADGEDKPEDITQLLLKANTAGGEKIIFASRNKRQDPIAFKVGYFIYKNVFRLLTGQKITVGNFSVIPGKLLSAVVHQENIWNHYSGGILSSRIPYDKIVLNRGGRYHGTSKMNFNSLILHGLSSISVYFDVLSLRILRISLYGIALCFAAIIYIILKKATGEAIPGWASSLILIIGGIILQLFSVTLIVLLLQLSSRKQITAPNTKRYFDFIAR